jgi:hypothetical protein
MDDQMMADLVRFCPMCSLKPVDPGADVSGLRNIMRMILISLK